MRNIAEMLRITTATMPDQVALSYNGESLTWREIYSRALDLRESLIVANVGRGDIVAIYAEHSPAQIIGIFAVAMADAAFTIINTLLKEDQVKHQVSDSNAKAIIGTKAFLNPMEQFWKERRLPIETLTEMGTISASSSKGTGTVDLSLNITTSIPTDVSNIIYTSGSTGRAKGVVIPQRTLLDGARIVSGYLRISKEDILLSMLPFSFDYGLNQLLTAVHVGAKIVLHQFTFPKDLVDVLIQERITGMAGVPSLWPNLFNPRLLDPATKPPFETLRYITTAGGMHSQELLTQLVSFFPKTEIIVMYGLTESFRSTYLPFSELFNRPGSIGKPVPEVEILVLNESGEQCKPEEKGELIHRGAFVSYGYLNDSELTASKFIELHTGGPGCRPEVVVRSGDIVSLDEDGYIYFHGRTDAQIKSGGYRVSPTEVEEAALRFPGLSHTAVYGVVDQRTGQSVHMAYSTYSGQQVEHSDLSRHLAELLPSYSVPKSIEFYPKLPMTPSGKIDYPTLIDRSTSRVKLV